ncbi:MULTISPECIES: hypothetical protein [Bradyrhizobium]|uniref:hypothetical protein n=1 Tax=Bradyrhizobium TaxID=374 RepID=UPI0027155C99|nr:hypothetical protein [Bradyrhizobium elkanii]WLA46686.1 hypothetical protein QIH80_33810 [Bradyrhizobium elkanii]WLB83030.1 hypothetical protein QIH83_10925 [Bradyrhizobium elkanii]
MLENREDDFMRRPQTGMLFAGEELVEHSGVRGLRYFRAGKSDCPLVVFLPGGVHLARISYGDPFSHRADFLDHWLEQKGIGLLALSYPTDHPSIGAIVPDLTIAGWANWIASVTSDVLRETPDRPVAVAMWSMAGRSVAAVNTALKARGIDAVCFLSLAASPPIAGLNLVQQGGDPLTPDGLWTGGVYIDGFLPSLSHQNQINGRRILDEQLYLEHYLCNTPVMLRGTSQRFSDQGTFWNFEEAHDDMRASSFSEFPLAATISPTDRSDDGHALADPINWNFFNIQMIRSQARALDFDAGRWKELRALTRTLPSRLSRDVAGGHFFFVGARGAEQTAHHITELYSEVRSLRAEIRALLE